MYYAALAVATVMYFAMIWAATVMSAMYGFAITQSTLKSFILEERGRSILGMQGQKSWVLSWNYD